MQDNLKERIKEVPEVPGVYIFKDEKGNVIYIGKAKNLKERLKEHFYSSYNHPRFEKLISKTFDFDYIVTDSEADSFLLEANLIKKYLPKYNVRLKDDKKYPYLKITINEEYPRIFKTRDIREDGSIIFGPFHSAKSLMKTLKIVLRIFPIRTCKYKLPSNVKINPCLEYYIKRCPAPCVPGNISPEEYKENVKKLIEFFSGKTNEIENWLEREIKIASKNLNFEKAMVLRDRLFALREIHKGYITQMEEGVSMDVIGFSRISKYALCLVFPIRKGRLQDKEDYLLEFPEEVSNEEIMEEFLVQYYSKGIIGGKKILIPLKIQNKRVIEEMLKNKRGLNLKISFKPKDSKEKRILEMANENAKFSLEEKLLEKGLLQEKVPISLLEIKDIFGLEKIPERIEAIDISQIFGDERVGAVVVFEGGKPKKSEYRKYKIKYTESSSDAHMIYEVIKRRIRRLKEENKNFPDIFIIDGGKPQLSLALKALKEENSENICVCAFAKTFDQFYFPDGKMITIPKTKRSALKLLKIIRNEAHRFAITYHRKKREKKIKSSIIDKIEGIGEKKKIMLLRYFGSPEKLFSASKEEIKKVKGIGEKLAEKIYEEIHKIEGS